MNFVANMLLKNANIQQAKPKQPPVDNRTNEQMRQQILKLLKTKRMTCRQIAKAVKRDYKNARRYLLALEKDGLIRSDGVVPSAGTKPAVVWTIA